MERTMLFYHTALTDVYEHLIKPYFINEGVHIKYEPCIPDEFDISKFSEKDWNFITHRSIGYGVCRIIAMDNDNRFFNWDVLPYSEIYKWDDSADKFTQEYSKKIYEYISHVYGMVDVTVYISAYHRSISFYIIESAKKETILDSLGLNNKKVHKNIAHYPPHGTHFIPKDIRDTVIEL